MQFTIKGFQTMKTLLRQAELKTYKELEGKFQTRLLLNLNRLRRKKGLHRNLMEFIMFLTLNIKVLSLFETYNRFET